MAQSEYYLTQEGLDNLKTEYERLKGEDWPEVLQRVSEARELGKLEDNQEYEHAKHAKDIIEGRMVELEDIIANAAVIAPERIIDGKIVLGSTVTVEVKGDHQTFTIVGSVEADPSQGKLSCESPVGQQLLGLEEGDIIEIKLPHATIEYKIIKIHR